MLERKKTLWLAWMCQWQESPSSFPPSSAIRQHFSKLTQGERVGLKFLQEFHIQKEVNLPLWERNQSSVSQHVFCHLKQIQSRLKRFLLWVQVEIDLNQLSADCLRHLKMHWLLFHSNQITPHLAQLLPNTHRTQYRPHHSAETSWVATSIQFRPSSWPHEMEWKTPNVRNIIILNYKVNIKCAESRYQIVPLFLMKPENLCCLDLIKNY